ncbi:MAG: hypothetical protein JXB24_03560 [Bacteroidales bacterium]|nr:hypothetical protein [Bacteroidales bacterium]
MNDLVQIETLGSLIKEEMLQTVEHNIVQNTFVLESQEPFPGYLGKNLPSEKKPESFYIVISKKQSIEATLRLTQNLCSYFNFKIDACPAEILLSNHTYDCIRLRGMMTYNNIADIQRSYSDAGFSLSKKRNIHAPGIIKINKVFCLEKIADHVYKDVEDLLTYYLTAPFQLDWNLFREVTINVKNNLDNSNFDAAMGFIYQKRILDFIRLYLKNPDVNRLQNIRNKYLEEIHKIRTI